MGSSWPVREQRADQPGPEESRQAQGQRLQHVAGASTASDMADGLAAGPKMANSAAKKGRLACSMQVLLPADQSQHGAGGAGRSSGQCSRRRTAQRRQQALCSRPGNMCRGAPQPGASPAALAAPQRCPRRQQQPPPQNEQYSSSSRGRIGAISPDPMEPPLCCTAPSLPHLPPAARSPACLCPPSPAPPLPAGPPRAQPLHPHPGQEHG